MKLNTPYTYLVKKECSISRDGFGRPALGWVSVLGAGDAKLFLITWWHEVKHSVHVLGEKRVFGFGRDFRTPRAGEAPQTPIVGT